MKSKAMNETHFLALLEKVLPKATQDPHLASRIYDEVVKEVRLQKNLVAFEKFCETGSLPDIEPQTVTEFQSDLAAQFGKAASVEIKPEESGKSIAVEIALPDRTVSSNVRIVPPGSEEEESKAPFVPFPVALPEDPELLWVLARRDDLSPDEAARALAKIEEEFWATKGGQKMLRDRVERSFAEFIAHVPAAMLGESGLKRHYKEPETLQTLRLLAPIVQDNSDSGRQTKADSRERAKDSKAEKKAKPEAAKAEEVETEEVVDTAPKKGAHPLADDDDGEAPWDTE